MNAVKYKHFIYFMEYALRALIIFIFILHEHYKLKKQQEHLKDISNISIAKCYTNLPANDNTSPSTEEIVRFGSRSVPKSMIDKLRHGKIGLLTNGLTEAVFTPEEMALSTVRGSKTNAHKGVFQKKTLDQSLVQAIIEYCATSFNKSTSEVSSEVIKSIGFKLNNFTKTEEGKKNKSRNTN